MRMRSLRQTPAKGEYLFAICLPALDAVTPNVLHRVDMALAADHAKGIRGDVQLALAEAMNNVSEHAYPDTSLGAVAVSVSRMDGALIVTVTDWGCGYTGDLTRLVQPDPQSLKEGGYGWFLIRELTVSCDYTQQAEKNRLRMVFEPPRAE
mgnify:CR=1 FL=1